MNDALFPKVLFLFFVDGQGAEPTTAHKKKKKKKKNKKILHSRMSWPLFVQGPNGVSGARVRRFGQKGEKNVLCYIYICTHAYVCVCGVCV